MYEPKRFWRTSAKAIGRERGWVAPRYLILASIVATYCLVATAVSGPTSALSKDVESVWNWLASAGHATVLQRFLFGNDADGGAVVGSAMDGVSGQRGKVAAGRQAVAGGTKNASDSGYRAAQDGLARLSGRSQYGSSTGSVGGKSGLEQVGGAKSGSDESGGAKSDSEVMTLEQAYLDESYTAKLSPEGGEAPFRARLSKGRLPVGLAIADDSPVLFGKPQAIGSYVFGVSFQDALDQIFTAYYRLEVVKREEDKESEPLKVLTMALRAGVVGQEYAAQVETEGGKLPKLFIISGLADGLFYNLNTGLIYGIPEKAGVFTVAVVVSTADSEQASAQLPMVVNDEPLEVVTAALPPAILGGNYAFQLEARGGHPPYVWSLTGGSLPSGLGLDSSGSISGNINGSAVGATAKPSNLQAGSNGGDGETSGSGSMRVTVMDRNKAADSVDLRLEVESGELQIVTDALPDGEVNRLYYTQLEAVGGMPPYVWELGAAAGSAAGSAAAQSYSWLSVSTGGSISGTPSAVWQGNIHIKLRDANGEARSRSVLLRVVDKVLTISPLSASNISACTSVSMQIEASGGQPPYSWSLVSSQISGVSVSPSGQLSIPSQVGDSAGDIGGDIGTQGGASGGESKNFVVQVSDSIGNTVSYTATVPGSPAPLRVLSLGEISCPVGLYCREQLLGSGGCPPYRWSVESGSLAPGLSLTATGLITGVAEHNGVITGATGDGSGLASASQDSAEQLKVAVTDSVGNKAVLPIRLYTPSDSSLSIDTTQLPEGRVGEAYQAQLVAVGGTGALLWSIVGGGLPEGVHLNSQTGGLQGVPTKDGVYSMVMRVTDGGQGTSGFGTAQVALQLMIANAELEIAPNTLQPPHGKVGTLWQHLLRAVGGKPPYRWELPQSVLPLGLTFDITNMQIVGTPEKSGVIRIPIAVTDSENAEVRAEMTVGFDAEELKILTTELRAVTVGELYTEELLFSGGTAPYFWSILAGDLPEGLMLSDDGVISGVVLAQTHVGGTGDNSVRESVSIELRDGSGEAVVQSVFLEVLLNAYSPVTNLVAVGSDGKVGLSWDNPRESEFAKVRIVKAGDGVPTNPYDGAIVYEGINNNAVDVEVENGVPYYYAAFAEYSGGDAGENFSALGKSSSTSATPRLIGEKGKPDACIDDVVAFAPLDRVGAYGARQLPGIVLGFPQGGGEYAGGSGVVSLNSRINDDNGRSAPYGGSITVRFADNIVVNGDGVDFTIFENAIHPRNSNEYFIEPAIVEVSVNGRDFFLFPFDFVPHYKSDGTLNLSLPATYRSGFAGVRPVYSNGSNPSPSNPVVSGGDSFDLDGISSVKLTWIQYVRITATGDNWLRDVNGDLVRHTNESPTWGASGRGNSGFDLDAVCAVNY